jgi:epoxyqueuosine reductase
MAVDLPQELRELAYAQGFSACGFAAAEELTEAGRIATERTQAGLMDGLPWYTEERVRQAADPRRTLPDARAIVALAFPYAHPTDEAPVGPARGRVAAYALGPDYHQLLRERMQPLLALLKAHGHRARTFVDHGRLLERAVAERAGIGWFGKNTNILTVAEGSWVLLAEIVTDAPLPPDPPLKKSCGQCTACIPACPTGALTPYALDNRRCISFLTIELRGPIPRELRPLMGNWIFGCDLCQTSCPVNSRKRSGDPAELAYYQDLVDPHPVLIELLALDDQAFRERFRFSAVWRTRRAGLLRNAAVALGNAGDGSAIPALARALRDREPLVRGHAAWALGRLGGPTAAAALAGAPPDADPWVSEEILVALADLSASAAGGS